MARAPKKAPEPAPEIDFTAQSWPADHVERMQVAELVPYARNARTHDADQVRQIAASIRQFGWTVPVLAAEDGTIIAGHGRILAAELLGIETVPVMTAVGWSDEQRRAYTLADNVIALGSGWDEDMLRLELRDLADDAFDLSLTGFGTDELENLLLPPSSTGSGDGAGEEGAYSRKIQAPIYTPGEVAPALSDLYNDTKATELVAQIRAADIPPEVARFLEKAAERHTVFNFAKIADWYAGAGPEEQRLAEASALVIIDFNQAIENGFSKLTQRLGELATGAEPADEE